MSGIHREVLLPTLLKSVWFWLVRSWMPSLKACKILQTSVSRWFWPDLGVDCKMYIYIYMLGNGIYCACWLVFVRSNLCIFCQPEKAALAWACATSKTNLNVSKHWKVSGLVCFSEALIQLIVFHVTLLKEGSQRQEMSSFFCWHLIDRCLLQNLLLLNAVFVKCEFFFFFFFTSFLSNYWFSWNWSVVVLLFQYNPDWRCILVY